MIEFRPFLFEIFGHRLSFTNGCGHCSRTRHMMVKECVRVVSEKLVIFLAKAQALRRSTLRRSAASLAIVMPGSTVPHEIFLFEAITMLLAGQTCCRLDNDGPADESKRQHRRSGLHSLNVIGCTL